MKISTKTGDKGKTKLVFMREVSKASQRVCAYGAIDDCSATIGLARSFADEMLAKNLLSIQENLVFLMTELATAKEDFPKLIEKNMRLLGDAELAKLESEIEELEKDGTIFQGWKQSGESPLQAALDMARTRCRNAEREIVKLSEEEGLARDFPLVYINRLSDLLYLSSQKVANKK